MFGGNYLASRSPVALIEWCRRFKNSRKNLSRVSPVMLVDRCQAVQESFGKNGTNQSNQLFINTAEIKSGRR